MSISWLSIPLDKNEQFPHAVQAPSHCMEEEKIAKSSALKPNFTFFQKTVYVVKGPQQVLKKTVQLFKMWVIIIVLPVGMCSCFVGICWTVTPSNT